MEAAENIIVEDTVDRRALAAENFFWLGFIIYASSFVISSTDEVNYVVCNVFQILGLFLLFPASALLFQLRIESGYLKVLFFIYFLWLMAVVMRGIKFDYLTIKQMLFDPNKGLLLYLVPLIILIPPNFTFIKKGFYTIIILGGVYLVYDLIFIKQLLFSGENMRSQAIFEYFTQQLSLPCGFLLLTYLYHSRKVNLFALFIIAISFLLAVIRARRGLILMTFSIMLFTYLVFQLVNKTRVVNIVLSLFFVTFITYLAVNIYIENRKNTFSLITERINQRTRSEVERYFYRDMSPANWIIGKGFNGEYFCPGVNEGEGRITVYRSVVETGYLQIILNGGIISLGLFLLIAIPAIIKGLFHSGNYLSKAAGLWILLLLFYLYPAMPAIFTLNFILVWISIGICYSPRLRNMSDDEILANFRSGFDK